MRFVESGLGEALGKRYVQKALSRLSTKRKWRNSSSMFSAAYRDSIDGLEWMSPATKREAKAKLATFSPKIGYTEKWRDYSALTISRDDLDRQRAPHQPLRFPAQSRQAGQTDRPY